MGCLLFYGYAPGSLIPSLQQRGSLFHFRFIEEILLSRNVIGLLDEPKSFLADNLPVPEARLDWIFRQ